MTTYRTMNDRTHADAVCEMMGRLYAEDAPASGNIPRDFRATIDYLLGDPARGRIVLLTADAAVCGYALLIPFWSNEMGGPVVTVDELFVAPDRRGRGIGRGLLAWVERERPYGAVAVFLEVSASNGRARKLYESLGFSERSNRTLTRLIPNSRARVDHGRPPEGG